MSVFRDSLAFFDTIGLFDVVLPFLLVFTLVFATLEKSRIFGTEKGADGKTEFPRKNLDAMVAFCTAFFVVASAQLVALVNVLVSRVALILVILTMFMLLVGALSKQQDKDGFDAPYKGALTAAVLVAVILIFLDGVGWLDPLWQYVTGNWDSQLVGTIALFGIIVGFMVYVTKGPKTPKPAGGGNSGGGSG